MLTYPPPPTAPRDLTVPATNAMIVLVSLSGVAVAAGLLVHLAGLMTIGLGLLLRAVGAEICCPGGRWYVPPRGTLVDEPYRAMPGATP